MYNYDIIYPFWKINMNIKKKNLSTSLLSCLAAFTLAEVLITLGVIGVVAAMTMPTLIQNHKKHVVENKLKANVALFQNALRMAESKHGQLNEWLGCDLSKESQGNCTRRIFDEYLAPELKVLKVCNYENIDECWNAPKALNTDVTSVPQPKAIGVVLSNGTSFYMWVGNVSSANYNPHIHLLFDIDGKDIGKNRMGGDVFRIAATTANNKGFMPYGSYESFYDDMNYSEAEKNSLRCTSDSTGASSGLHCISLIVQNGWKIPKDYPVRF